VAKNRVLLEVCTDSWHTVTMIHIAANLHTGTSCAWVLLARDSKLTSKRFQVDVSPIDLSHTEPIYDFAWLQSKTGSEVMTVSSEGLVLWWDIRMFGEYTAKLALDKNQEIIESLPLREKGAEHCQVRLGSDFVPPVVALRDIPAELTRLPADLTSAGSMILSMHVHTRLWEHRSSTFLPKCLHMVDQLLVCGTKIWNMDQYHCQQIHCTGALHKSEPKRTAVATSVREGFGLASWPHVQQMKSNPVFNFGAERFRDMDTWLLHAW
jgi:hypothetical protein